MKLRFKAATKEGKTTRGLLEAKDIKEAAEYLRAKGLVPIDIEKTDKLLSRLPFFNSVKQGDIILFTRQLSSMLSSGLTVIKSLEILKEQMKNSLMTEVITALITDVKEGKTLGQALEKHPKFFSQIYVSIIKAGEESGLLDKVLLRLAENLEKQAKLKATIKSALTYPVIVIVLMFGVMLIMTLFVIPQLDNLYKSLNIPLPLPTKIIIGLSKFMISAWPFIIGIVIIVIYAFRKWVATPDGRLIIDALLLRLPVFGNLISKTILAEFARTFGLLVGTGTLVVEALVETADTTGNVLFKTAIMDVSKMVEKGVSVGNSMEAYPLFPPLLIQLVKIGEETGKVDETLIRASEYFEREVDQSVKTLTTAMEPFIMLVLGIGVAILIFSVITPIYSLITTIQ